MLTVVQRVTQASVRVNNEVIGKINSGLMILCGFEGADKKETLQTMLDKCLNYRIFSDEQGKMNRSLKEIEGGLLLVPQFTLMADTSKGLRPSFSRAAPPDMALSLFTHLVNLAKQHYGQVSCGEFGADMQVELCNDGPVTFLLNF